MRYIKNQKKTDGTWFAWYPVKNNNNEWVWLETLERTGIYVYGDFMYFSYSSNKK